MRLKPLDWALVRELFRWEGNQPQGALRVPIGPLAKRTGAHPNTVRARLQAMLREGVVEGLMFEPWPRAVGLVRSAWMLPGTPRASEDDVRRAMAAEPTVAVAVHGLDWVFAHLWEPSDASAAETAARLANGLGAGAPVRHFTSTAFPPSPADAWRLSELEGRLILALRRGPRRSLAQVARELRVTPRTAERTAQRLFQAGVGGMIPRFRPARVEGEVLVHIVLVDGDERAAASLAKAFPDRFLGPFGRGINTGISVAVPNLDTVVRRREAAERMPGITRLEVLLYRDILFSDRFEAHLAKAVATQQPAVARG